MKILIIILLLKIEILFLSIDFHIIKVLENNRGKRFLSNEY